MQVKTEKLTTLQTSKEGTELWTFGCQNYSTKMEQYMRPCLTVKTFDKARCLLKILIMSYVQSNWPKSRAGNVMLCYLPTQSWTQCEYWICMHKRTERTLSYRTGLAVVVALLWSAWMSLESPRLEVDVVQPPPFAKAFPLPVSAWWRWLELLRVLLQDDWEVG